MFNQDDMVEFTKKKRQEHDMRGFEPEDLINDPDCDLLPQDLVPFFYPSDEDIEEIDLRGIYLSNFIPWNAKKQTEMMIDKYGFETAQKWERTFNLYDKIEDIHANGVHDYLKYLKFGYGRATDDASTEIRQRRMTREEGIAMVMQYDHVRPSDLDLYLAFVEMTEEEFEAAVEDLRDPSIWEKGSDGQWRATDNIGNHINDPGVDAVRLSLEPDRTGFIKSKRSTYERDDHIYEDEVLNKQSEYVIL
jgi:hypothetical protein